MTKNSAQADSVITTDEPGTKAHQAFFIALCALTGILTGVAGSYFHLIINWLLLWPHTLSTYFSGATLVVAAALITMVCTVLAAFLVRRLAPEAGGSGVQEIEGAMEGLRVVRWRRILPVKFGLGIVALSSGLVLGREGPTIHIGASLGAAINDFVKTNIVERRGLLAAGAAAGLACAFNAPLAGAVFIIEEMRKQFPYSFRTYMGVMVASFFATIMCEIIGGKAPDFTMPAMSISSTWLPGFVVLGCLLGLIGVALNSSLLWTGAFATRLHARIPYIFPAIVGLIIGALMILVPLAVRGGELAVVQLTSAHSGLAILLALAVLRFLTMVGSYSTGVPGGIFAPILALATCVGLFFGGALSTIIPDASEVSLAFAIAAMGGLFTASVRAPLVGIVLTVELTGLYELILPLIATCVSANLIAQLCGGKPIYEQLLQRTLAQSSDKIR